MRLISIHNELLKKFAVDKEVLQKSGRPYVLVLQLMYKGKRQNFAIPIRSNIPSASPKNEYFPLPPRPSTRPKNRHGLHYIKMFPVTSKYYLRYRTENNEFATLIKDIIDNESKQIISECQEYLNRYENGNRSQYATDIDLLISILHQNK